MMNRATRFQPFASSLWHALAFALISTSACDESGPRVYTAKAYDSEAQCLAADAPIGLVEAEDLKANCDPTCLELGGQLYVSTVCPPYPADSVALTSADSADCAMALTAFENQVECEE